MQRIIVIPKMTLTGTAPTALIGIPSPGLAAVGFNASQINLTATYTGPPALATYTFQTLLNGTWVTLAVQTSPNYAHMNVASGVMYYYQVNIQTAETPPRSSMWSGITEAMTVPTPTLTITTASPLSQATQGNAYSTTFAASGGTPPYAWTLLSSNVSMNLTTDGTLSFTPTVVQTDSVSVQLTDSVGATASRTFTIVVNAAPTVVATGLPWYPTLHAMSVAAPPSGNLSNYENEINVYAASIAANPGLQAIVGGYTFYVGWNILEPTTQGVYAFSIIGQVYNYLQSKVPGARMVVQPTCYSNWLSTFSSTAGSSILPTYVYNGSTATYGKPSVGGSGAGWGLIAYSSANSHYGQVIAMLDNVNVSNGYQNMQIAMLKYIAANCPNCDGELDYTPSEFANFQSNPTTPPNYSSTGWVNNWISRAEAIRASVPALISGSMMEYTSTGMVDADLQNMVNSTANAGSAFSCTDVFWSGTAIDPTEGQNLFTGTTAGSTSQIGKTISFPTVQPEDFERTGAGGSSTPNVASQIQNILSLNCYAHLKASHVAIAMASETAATTPVAIPAFSLKAWYDTTKTGTAGNGFILNGILAAGGIPTANQALPLNLMSAVQNLTAAANSPTNVALAWSVQGGVTYLIYRNNVQIGTATTGSYTDTMATASTAYTYAVAMTNAYGTGVRASVSLTTPGIPVSGGSGISLAWTAPTQYTDGSAITDPITYNIYQAPGNTVDGPTATPVKVLSGITTTSVSITSGLVSGTLYYFEITDVIGGIESAFTQPVYVTAP